MLIRPVTAAPEKPEQQEGRRETQQSSKQQASLGKEEE